MARKIVRRMLREGGDIKLDDLPDLLQRVYNVRNINNKDDLGRELSHLLPYHSMMNIDLAVTRLVEALENQHKILISGDFDADGATSTALAVKALKAMGVENVSYIVPNRFEFGYGLTPEIVDVIANTDPDLIITVDNGISSHAGVARARELGMDVLITDHHLQGKTLPLDCIIVNPNQVGDLFPSKTLAGVGVIFYVMLALRARLKENGWFEKNNIPCPNMAQYLDLVALGTVSDVVPLDKNNRIMVYQGLKRIRKGRACAGINALLEVSGRDREFIRATDLGFSIGPRLNAAGRLDDMSYGISCLLADSYSTALEKARMLDGFNKERRSIETHMQKEALAMIDKIEFKGELPFGLCLYEECWHQGVVGLVASRIKEKFNRPIIAFAMSDDGTLKGSARSIPGVHIRNVLELVATLYPGLITKFGGHAMAAGMSLEFDKLEEFRQAFDTVLRDKLKDSDLVALIESDGLLKGDDYNLNTAYLIREAGPWGQGFPEPIFDGEFAIVEQRIVGKNHLKLLLMASNCDFCLEAIAFNVNLDEWPNQRCNTANIAFRLDINRFRGREKLQLLVEEIQAIQNA